jgi:hypothetical protein
MPSAMLLVTSRLQKRVIDASKYDAIMHSLSLYAYLTKQAARKTHVNIVAGVGTKR